MNQKYKNLIGFIISLIIIYSGFQIFKITCPIKMITGISCPGCGMTRAYLSLLRFDIAKAFYYHPLFFLPPIMLMTFLFYRYDSHKWFKIGLWICVGLFFIVYAVRMSRPNDPIVVFQPHESWLYRMYMKIKEVFS